MIRKKLQIEKFQDKITKTVNKKNYLDEYEFDDVIVESINKAFRIRGKLFSSKVNRLELTKFYMAKINSLFGWLVDAKRMNKKINKNKHTINVFNNSNIFIFNKIIKFKFVIQILFIKEYYPP